MQANFLVHYLHNTKQRCACQPTCIGTRQLHLKKSYKFCRGVRALSHNIFKMSTSTLNIRSVDQMANLNLHKICYSSCLSTCDNPTLGSELKIKISFQERCLRRKIKIKMKRTPLIDRNSINFVGDCGI